MGGLGGLSSGMGSGLGLVGSEAWSRMCSWGGWFGGGGFVGGSVLGEGFLGGRFFWVGRISLVVCLVLWGRWRRRISRRRPKLWI